MPKQKWPRALCIVFAAVLMLSACARDEEKPPAPLDNLEALEKLAETYNIESENWPINPARLNAQERRDFVNLVFDKAGYSYQATLHALAKSTDAQYSTSNADLAQLVLMPRQSLSEEDLALIYTAEDIEALHHVERKKSGLGR